jgi:hypothetical protein
MTAMRTFAYLCNLTIGSSDRGAELKNKEVNL